MLHSNIPQTVQQRLAALDAILAQSCRRWLAELPANAELHEIADIAGIGHAPTLDELGAIRNRITSLKAQASQPTPVRDIEAEAKRWVEGRATLPTVRLAGGRFEVDMPANPVGLLCAM